MSVAIWLVIILLDYAADRASAVESVPIRIRSGRRRLHCVAEGAERQWAASGVACARATSRNAIDKAEEISIFEMKNYLFVKILHGGCVSFLIFFFQNFPNQRLTFIFFLFFNYYFRNKCQKSSINSLLWRRKVSNKTKLSCQCRFCFCFCYFSEICPLKILSFFFY